MFTGGPVYRFTAKFTGFAAKFAGFTAKFAGFTAKFTGFTVKFTGFTASVNIRVGFRFTWVYRFIPNPLTKVGLAAGGLGQVCVHNLWICLN